VEVGEVSVGEGGSGLCDPTAGAGAEGESARGGSSLLIDAAVGSVTPLGQSVREALLDELVLRSDAVPCGDTERGFIAAEELAVSLLWTAARSHC
jgi:hypothetical protein